jgi:hypothetical protein
MMFNRATSLMSRKIEWMSAFTKSMLIRWPEYGSDCADIES